MTVEKQKGLKLIGVEITKVNFGLAEPVTHEAELDTKLEVTPKIYFPNEPKDEFMVHFNTKINIANLSHLEVSVVGHFQLLGAELNEEIKSTFINLNAPAIVFPYVRSFIATFSANVGRFPTIQIPPQHFSGDIPVIHEDDIKDED